MIEIILASLAIASAIENANKSDIADLAREEKRLSNERWKYHDLIENKIEDGEIELDMDDMWINAAGHVAVFVKRIGDTVFTKDQKVSIDTVTKDVYFGETKIKIK